MLTCHDVAKYFLSLVDEDAGDSITNLKLQKLVYYAQGYALAILDRPLFHEEFVAWAHGPVVPELYRSFKQHKSEPIPSVNRLPQSAAVSEDWRRKHPIFSLQYTVPGFCVADCNQEQKAAFANTLLQLSKTVPNLIAHLPA